MHTIPLSRCAIERSLGIRYHHHRAGLLIECTVWGHGNCRRALPPTRGEVKAIGVKVTPQADMRGC